MPYTDLSNAFGFGTRLTAAQMSQLRDNTIAVTEQQSGDPQPYAMITQSSYIGNGTTSRFIGGDFEYNPCMVIVVNLSGGITIKTDTMQNTYSLQTNGLFAPVSSERGIQEIINHGFRVRHVDYTFFAPISCNNSGDTYYYFAIKPYSAAVIGSATNHTWNDIISIAVSGDTIPSSHMQMMRDNIEAITEQASGAPALPIIYNNTYTGNGSANNIIGIPWQPTFAAVFGNPVTAINSLVGCPFCFKHVSFPNCLSIFPSGTNFIFGNDGIKSITGSQMAIGDASINTSGQIYHYVLFRGVV